MGRVPHDGRASGDIADNHRSHADRRALSDGNALFNEGPRSDVGTVSDSDVAVAVHAGGEGDVIANSAFVRDVAVDIAVEVATDTDLRFNKRVVSENRTLPDVGVLRPDGSGREQLGKPGESFGNPLARIGACDGYAVIRPLWDVIRTQDGNAGQLVGTVVADKAHLRAMIAQGLDGVEHLKGETARAVNSKHGGVIADRASRAKRLAA